MKTCRILMVIISIVLILLIGLGSYAYVRYTDSVFKKYGSINISTNDYTNELEPAVSLNVPVKTITDYYSKIKEENK